MFELIFQIIVSYSPYTKKDQSLFDHIKQCITYEADTDNEEINPETESDIRNNPDFMKNPGNFERNSDFMKNPGNFERQHEEDHSQSVENHTTLEKNPTPINKNENNQPKRPKQTNITHFFKESPK